MAEEQKRLICGIVMPISMIDDCTETHWGDVRTIMSEAIEDAGFEPRLVSFADETGLIHKRIIQNLYDNPVVVCDVSGKNPNVMFELGLRLAFDKPTIIVKDDHTSYSFDTGGIEHLEYPRDLRFSKIVEFKERLSEKIIATHQRADNDPDYTTFLKNFGEFKVAKIDKTEVSGQEYIIDELRDIKAALSRIDGGPSSEEIPGRINASFCLLGMSDGDIARVLKIAQSHPKMENARIVDYVEGHKHLRFEVEKSGGLSQLEARRILGLIPSIRPRRGGKLAEPALIDGEVLNSHVEG